MAEVQETTTEEDPDVPRDDEDPNILQIDEEQIWKDLEQYEYKSLKRKDELPWAQLVHTLFTRYDIHWADIVERVTGDRRNAGTFASKVKKILEDKAKDPAEKQASKVAEKQISDIIAKEIKVQIFSFQELGNWLTKTYGPVAQLNGVPIEEYVSAALDFYMFEKPVLEALVEEMFEYSYGDQQLIATLTDAASPHFLAREKMRNITQITELVAMIQAQGLPVPQELIAAHTKAMEEIETGKFGG